MAVGGLQAAAFAIAFARPGQSSRGRSGRSSHGARRRGLLIKAIAPCSDLSSGLSNEGSRSLGLAIINLQSRSAQVGERRVTKPNRWPALAGAGVAPAREQDRGIFQSQRRLPDDLISPQGANGRQIRLRSQFHVQRIEPAG